MARLLVDGGAKLTVRDGTERTAQEWTAEKNFNHILEALDGDKFTEFFS